MTIGIINYGMGNLRSVQKALELLGCQATIVASPAELEATDKLILPGVGAFQDAMTHLGERRLIDPIRAAVESQKPMLGICLGLQLLFERSYEDGEHEGLCLLPGAVRRFETDDPTLKIPHMGWNAIRWPQSDTAMLFQKLEEPAHVYFVHSYYADPTDDSIIAATADYPTPFCAAVRKGNLFATQFHPEKSQRVGLEILKAFAEL